MYMSLHFSLSFHIFVDEFSSPSLFRLSFAIHHANPFRKIMQTFDGRHKITSVDIELIVISFELAYIYQTRYCQCWIYCFRYATMQYFYLFQQINFISHFFYIIYHNLLKAIEWNNYDILRKLYLAIGEYWIVCDMYVVGWVKCKKK